MYKTSISDSHDRHVELKLVSFHKSVKGRWSANCNEVLDTKQYEVVRAPRLDRIFMEIIACTRHLTSKPGSKM